MHQFRVSVQNIEQDSFMQWFVRVIFARRPCSARRSARFRRQRRANMKEDAPQRSLSCSNPFYINPGAKRCLYLKFLDFIFTRGAASLGRRPGARFFEKYTADFEKMFNSSTRVVKTIELYVNCPDLHFQSFFQVHCVQNRLTREGKKKEIGAEKKIGENAAFCARLEKNCQLKSAAAGGISRALGRTEV